VYSLQFSETFIGMFTLYIAVRLLWLCVQCTVQSEIVIGVWTLNSPIETVIGVGTVDSAK